MDFWFDSPGGDELIYNGYVLATALKNRYKDIPIVLFTRVNIFNVYEFPKNIADITDDIIFKSKIVVSTEDEYIKLHSLALGYKTLGETEDKSWSSLLDLLKPPHEAIEDLRNTNPPKKVDSNLDVTDSAQWIRNVLLRYPGILLNELWAATYLGISIDSFRSLGQLFDSGLYKGIF